MKIIDENHEVVGYVEESAGGVKTIYDSYHRVLGYVKEGKTYDKNHRIVAYGDSPGMLLG